MRDRDRYRIENGTIYEYDSKHNAYICVGKALQYTKNELIKMNGMKCNDDHEIEWNNDNDNGFDPLKDYK